MTSRTFRPRTIAVAAAALAVVLAGCGSKSATSTTTAPTTSTTATTAPTTSTTTSSTATCSTAVLAASATFGGTAAGSSYYTVSVKNNGPKPCALDGYPTYRFLGTSGAGGAGAGAQVQIAVVDRGPAPAPVVVAPQSTADSIIVYSDVGGSTCPTIASALLTPPRSSESLSFPISFSPCGGSVAVYAFGTAGSESP